MATSLEASISSQLARAWYEREREKWHRKRKARKLREQKPQPPRTQEKSQ
ncbi:MAG TPA: hypothetical protein VNQ79_05320 [Blastocatellia bacterium]|nr:hypothetical protein [Blastocatellia bacterium]